MLARDVDGDSRVRGMIVKGRTQHVSNVLWGAARCGVDKHMPKLFRDVGREAEGIVERANKQEVVNIVWSTGEGKGGREKRLAGERIGEVVVEGDMGRNILDFGKGKEVSGWNEWLEWSEAAARAVRI